MRPLIYKDRAGKQDKAAKQRFYRFAKANGMTCAEYRAAITAGTVAPPPDSFDEVLDTQVYEGGYVNKGWFGQKGGGVTRKRKTHSPKPDTCECNRHGTPCSNTAEYQYELTGVWYCAECWRWLMELLRESS